MNVSDNCEYIKGEIVDATECVHNHLSTYIGDVTKVFSSGPGGLFNAKDIDVGVIEPTEERPFYTLSTLGMSNITMAAPEGEMKHIELIMCLPADWDFRKENQIWPVRMMKDLAWYVYSEKTYLGVDHTLPNGEPPEPWSPDTEMCGVLVSLPILTPAEFCSGLDFQSKQVSFLSLIPLYLQEMDLKISQGSDALYECFERHQVSELFDAERPVSCLSKRTD